MNASIMKYIPKSKKNAVRDCYKDEDGYWICLNEGWEASNMDAGCRTIHESYIRELRYQIAGIRKVDDLYSVAAKTAILGTYLESAGIPRDDNEVRAAALYLYDTHSDNWRFEGATRKEIKEFAQFVEKYCGENGVGWMHNGKRPTVAYR